MADTYTKHFPSPVVKRETNLTPPNTPLKPRSYYKNQVLPRSNTSSIKFNDTKMSMASQQHPKVQPIYYISRSSTQTYLPLIATDELPNGICLTLDSETADRTTGPPVFLGEYSHSGSRFCLDLKLDAMTEEDVTRLFSDVVAKMGQHLLVKVLYDLGFDLSPRGKEEISQSIPQTENTISEEDLMRMEMERLRFNMLRFGSQSSSRPKERANPSRCRGQSEIQHLQVDENRIPQSDHPKDAKESNASPLSIRVQHW
jgi:hypothetical protein